MNCNAIFYEFDKQYSILLKEIVPSCPKCGTDILNNTFLPLDKEKRVIT
jgi:hypothetical protein